MKVSACRPLRVAAAQVAIDVDAPDATWRGAVALLEQAVSDGADLVVLPELVTSGSGFADAAEATGRAEPVTGPTVTALRELSARHGIVLVAGFNETSGLDRPYNSAVVIDRGELLTCYRKTHLWDREKLLFTPGDQPPPVVATSVGRIGLVVCYDLEFPEVTRRLALEDAQIVVAPANWPLLGKPAGERPVEVQQDELHPELGHDRRRSARRRCRPSGTSPRRPGARAEAPSSSPNTMRITVPVWRITPGAAMVALILATPPITAGAPRMGARRSEASTPFCSGITAVSARPSA